MAGIFIGDEKMKPYLLFVLLCAAALSVTAQTNQWPSFRGEFAAGVADKQNLPDTWDGAKGTGVKWKVRIPGLAHSASGQRLQRLARRGRW